MGEPRLVDDCSVPGNPRSSLIERVLLVHLQQRLQDGYQLLDHALVGVAHEGPRPNGPPARVSATAYFSLSAPAAPQRLQGAGGSHLDTP